MNNITEYQQKEIYSHGELRRIADKIAEELEKELSEFHIRTMAEYDRIFVAVGTKYYEISEAVNSTIENAYNMNEEFAEEIDNMSEEEIGKLFEEQYNDLLQEINQESCVYVNGKIVTQKYTITFEPLECQNDYCISGLFAEIELKDKIDSVDISNIAQLIITVFRL